MNDKAELAGHYSFRADDARRIAEGIFDWEERKKLLEITDEYEQRAREIEEMDSASPRLEML